MKAFVTGATGFIGGHLAERLHARGDEVVALVRSPDKATKLRELGCDLVEGDLGDEPAIRRGVAGCDAASTSAPCTRSASGSPNTRPCTTRTSKGPSGCSMPPSMRGWGA